MPVLQVMVSFAFALKSRELDRGSSCCRPSELEIPAPKTPWVSDGASHRHTRLSTGTHTCPDAHSDVHTQIGTYTRQWAQGHWHTHRALLLCKQRHPHTVTGIHKIAGKPHNVLGSHPSLLTASSSLPPPGHPVARAIWLYFL